MEDNHQDIQDVQGKHFPAYCQDIFYIFHWGEPIRLGSLNQCVDPGTCGSPFRAACKQPVLSSNYEWTDTVLGKGIADTAMSIFQIIEEFLTVI